MHTFDLKAIRQTFRFGPGLLLLLAILALQLATACDVGAEEQAPGLHISTAEQLQAAIRKDGVAPGTTIWLAAGSYAGYFVSDLSCTADQPCTIRPEPGSSVRLDGSLALKGGYTTWRDLEITNTSWTTRQGDNLPQIHSVVEVFGPGIRLINNVVHDLAGGIYGYNGAADNLWYGNVVFNNGYLETDGEPVGHGFYLQNENGTKRLADNVVVNQYNFGIHAYGSSQASLRHIIIDRNVQANNRWLIGGGSPATDIQARGNLLYNSNMQFGYSNKLNEDAEIHNNYIANGTLQIHGWKTLDVQFNTIVSTHGTNANFKFTTPVTATQSIVWTNNTYYRPETNDGKPFDIDGEGFYTLPEWQSRTHYDATSKLRAELPQQNAVFVRANEFDASRATVTIYNWQNQATVAVDLSSLNLRHGQAYRLRNAQNYLKEWRTFVYDGAPIAVPMEGWTVATPYGASTPLAASTFPQFGTFILEPAGQKETITILPAVTTFTTFLPISQRGV
jgi:hypothetical protein